MNLGLVDCVWWDLGTINQLLWLNVFLLYVKSNICFHRLQCSGLEMTLYWSELPVFLFPIMWCCALVWVKSGICYNLENCILSNTFKNFLSLHLSICSNIMLIAAYLWKSEHCKVCRWKLKVSYFLSLLPIYNFLLHTHC